MSAERLEDLKRRMRLCVTSGDHEGADEMMIEAVRLLPGGDELAAIYETVDRDFSEPDDDDTW